jgi:hypothetical protein|tara:strand:- start:838 stop:1221 length:384 start_codon:yes stop_codon:yes gene_type:complete
MRSVFNNIIRIIKENILLIFILVVVVLVSAYAEGNDLDFTIDNQTDGGTFNSVQDGQDNDIDFDIVSMDNFIIDIDQIGNNNTLDIDVDGRTSDGSSMYFNQTGNNKSYSGSFWCGHSFCTMTINQN